ncbi:hypothetical protein ACFVYG_23635 [Streptomyces sp. NPDC058256]|uniref:hypothetical protein n=1 Tax=Streptomyces sp. NPDC058256 TaxID=3346408 RepID=UPI0036EF727A
MTNAIHRPGWIPASGHQLRVTGVYFDAVRIEGVRGERVAGRLIDTTDGDAGPIVCEATGYRWMYFLLAPGEVRRHDWPLGVQQFGGKSTLTLTYIGIPALGREHLAAAVVQRADARSAVRGRRVAADRGGPVGLTPT